MFSRKSYVVDINYESRLFHDCQVDGDTCRNCSLKNSKENKEFEYVFFLLNSDSNCCLKNCRTYSEEYLSSLLDLGFKIPTFSDDDDFEFFWGRNLNRDLEQMLNSKVMLY